MAYMDESQSPDDPWLALVVGNSRLHWGAFSGDRWQGSWHTPYLSKHQLAHLRAGGFKPSLWFDLAMATPLQPTGLPWPEFWVASVVQPQANLVRDVCQDYPGLHLVTLSQVPLTHTYPSLGVDRALALVGAGAVYGWPVLVIDGGTALTLTAGVNQGLMGGAILPGIALQLRSLHDATDQLPPVTAQILTWPARWARDTATAMTSGILHSLVAGVADFIMTWWQDFPGGQVVITGGDGPTLLAGLNHRDQELASQLNYDPDVVFWGLRLCRQETVDRSDLGLS